MTYTADDYAQLRRVVLTEVVKAHRNGGPLPTMDDLVDGRYVTNRNVSRRVLAQLEEAGAIRRKNSSPRYGLVLEHPEVKRAMGGAK